MGSNIRSLYSTNLHTNSLRSFNYKNMKVCSKDRVNMESNNQELNIQPFLDENGTGGGDPTPNIVLSNTEKERNVISFGNNKNSVIEGIEVIRPDENQASFEDFLANNSPQNSVASGFKKEKPSPQPTNKKITKIDIPQPPMERKDSFSSSIVSREEPNKESTTFENLTSFMNPEKQKPNENIENTNDNGGGYYSSDDESYKKADSSIGSPRSRTSYQNYQQYNEPNEPTENSNDRWRREEEEKQELLIKLQQLESKGVRLSRSFSMKSKLDDIKFEFESQKAVIEQEESVKFMQNALITFTHGVEIMNKKFDPIGAKLSGWSGSVMEDIGSYEGIFERLHEKYKGSVEMAPELELLMTLAQSAFMFHLMESMFKGALPNLRSNIQSDPNLMQGLMGATARAADQTNNQRQNNPQPSNSQPTMSGPSFDIAGMMGPLMSGLMGGMGGGMGGLGGLGGAMPNRSGPMGPGPSQVPPGPSVVPPGVNAFREAMNQPPPPPMSTREVPRKYPPKSSRGDDNDRFSIASSNSDGSEITNNLFSESSDKKSKKKTYIM